MARLSKFPPRNCGPIPRVSLSLDQISRIPDHTLTFPLFFRERKPAFCHISKAFEHLLHFLMLFLEPFVIGVFGHLKQRCDDQNGARVRLRYLHQVPCLLKRPRAIESDVKQKNRPASPASQHHRAGLGHIPRPARAIDGEAGIDSLFEPLRHYRKSAQSSARRTSLRRAVPQPLDHAARPLPIEIRRVHEHAVTVSEVPGPSNDAAMPESVDVRRQVRPVVAPSFLAAQDLESNRWPE